MRSNLTGKLVPLGAVVLVATAALCDGDPAGLPSPRGEIIVAFDDDLDRWPRDDWDLVDLRLDGDAAEITVSYGGGCRQHELWLLAVDGFEHLPDAGITPTVAVPVLLAHDAHDDPCEQLVINTEEFRLQPLREAFEEELGTSVGRIILKVPAGQGASDTTQITFTFD